MNSENIMEHHYKKPSFYSPVLDLARGGAAFIVFFGHLFMFFPTIDLNHNRLLAPFTTGAACVSFFFTLSGYVLTKSFRKSKWKISLTSRVIRLYPIYFACWLIPLLGAYVTQTGHSLNKIGYFLGLFAMQSFSKVHYLDQPNPALWSLSVEIWLSPLFFFVKRFSSQSLTLMTVIALGFNFVHLNVPYSGSISFFLLGILISKIDYFLDLRLRRVLCFILLILYFIFALPLRSSPSNPATVSFLFVWIFCLMLVLTSMSVPIQFNKIARIIGTRSYCFYALHLPVIMYFDHLYIKAKNEHLVFFLIFVFALVTGGTEILFRLIDAPSIKFARKLRMSHEN